MSSRVLRGMTKDGNVRFLIADTTDIVNKGREIHGCYPTSTAAFGRVLTAASLMGKLLKNDNDKITLQIKGSGDIKSILTVADSTGNVKGYISNPRVNRAPNSSGKLDVGGAIGAGQVIVIKDYGLKEPFVGKIDLVNGEIAEDLAAYFMYSEQQPSIVSLGVYVDTDGAVSFSGGLIIQPMPYAEDEVIDKLENAASKMETFTSMQRKGMSLEEIIAETLSEFEIDIFDNDSIDFVCDCSVERIEGVLVSLGREELGKIIEEDGKAEVQCHFCNKRYVFGKEELEDIKNAATSVNSDISDN